MKNNLLYFLSLLVGLLVTSCQEDLEVGDAGSVILSGDWVVEYYPYKADKSQLESAYGPYTIQIYNTSFGTDSVWVDNIWDDGIKIKSAKTSETTFAINEAADFSGGFSGTVSISEAEVINNDSIIYRVVLTNADGTTEDDYYAAGHRYTGWPDDQH